MEGSSSAENPPDTSLSSQNLLALKEFRIGSWNAGKRKESNFQKAIDYCKHSQCNIICLQETNYIFSEIVRNDYQLISFKKKEWPRGKGPKNKLQDRGLAFFIRKPTSITIIEHDQPHARLAWLKFITNEIKVLLLNIYAVVSDTNDRSKELDGQDFFDYVETFLKNLPDNFCDVIIACGDLNAFPTLASLGLYELRIMKHVLGSHNSHGVIFFNFLRSTKLHHLNSRFQKSKARKWTRCGNRNNENTEVDAFLCQRTNLVQDVDTFETEEIPSDHRLIGSVWMISKDLENYLSYLTTEVEEQWSDYKDRIGEAIVYTTISQYDELLAYLIRKKPNNSDPVDYFTKLNHLLVNNEEITGVTRTQEEAGIYLKNILGREDNDVPIEEFGRLNLEEREVWTIEEIEVNVQVEQLSSTLQPGIDGVSVHMIKYGGPVLVKAIYNLFNDVLKENGIPTKWKTVVLKLPNQTVFPEQMEMHYFKANASLLVHMFSDLLIQRCYKDIWSYIYGNEYDEEHYPDIDTLRNEKKTENVLTLKLLLEKYRKSKKPLFFVFMNYQNPLYYAKVSSVLESLKKANVLYKYIRAFSCLLSDVNAKVENNSFDFRKYRGVHVGNVASTLLTGCVLKAVFDQCDRNLLNVLPNAGIQVVEGRILRRIQFDDTVVLIDESVKNIEDHLQLLARESEKYGLFIDKESIILTKSFDDEPASISFDGMEFQTNERPFQAVSYLGHIIAVNEKSKFEILERYNKAIEEIDAVEPFVDEDNDKKEFFKQTLIPLYFDGCGTWKFTKPELANIKENVHKFLRDLDQPLNLFSPTQHIITEKARLFYWISERPDRICSTILRNLNIGNSTTFWTSDLITSFRKFKRTLNADARRTVGAVQSHRLITIASEPAARWEDFIAFLAATIFT